MIFASDRIGKVAFSPVRKVLDRARELEGEGRSIIHFEIGEPDFDTPSEIVEETKKAMDAKLTHYGPNRGTLALRREISKKLKDENDINYDPETEILLTAGAAEGILDTLLAFINAGDEVIILTPAYMNYRNMLNLVGAVTIEIPLKQEDDFQIDVKALEASITPKTKMLIINDPQNPSGTVYDANVLEKIAELMVKYNILVLSDEIYERIIYDGIEHTSIAKYENMKERTIIVNGFSKSFAMTGWRVGYLAAHSTLIPPILKMHQYNTTCLPVFVQEGLSKCMNSPACKAKVEEMVANFAKRREILLDGLGAIHELSLPQPRGAFYAFVNVSGTGMDGTRFAQELLENQGVALVPGSGFGNDFSNYVRISYATSEESIIEGVRRISAFVNNLKLPSA